MTALDVYEIYPSIQGESAHAGRKCVFVRLTGCNLSCSYCDSQGAVRGAGAKMDVSWIVEDVRRRGIGLVELTGGEPLLQPGAGALLTALLDLGFETLVETNGSVDIGPFDRRAKFIVDIKTPGSGAGGSFNEKNLAALTRRDEVKLVLTGRDDFDWAVAIAGEYRLPEKCAVHFSPAFGLVEPIRLAEWLLASGVDARLNLQLHKIIWGPDATGV
jgi:7-carboxy-7-deazaguanine synthase